jgi:hypothetical protein
MVPGDVSMKDLERVNRWVRMHPEAVRTIKLGKESQKKDGPLRIIRL